MIVVIDNYDSFVHNLARCFRRWGQATVVVRNDAITADDIRRLAPAAVVLSPGPGTPLDAGVSLEIIAELAGELPLLGVCLGHQAIAAALGARVLRSPCPWHGRCSEVFHDQIAEFEGIPNAFVAGRYHSLMVDPAPERFPADLQVSAWTSDGLIMGLRHRVWPIFGWQFHPESILTTCGLALVGGFLRAVKVPRSPRERNPRRMLSVAAVAPPAAIRQIPRNVLKGVLMQGDFR